MRRNPLRSIRVLIVTTALISTTTLASCQLVKEDNEEFSYKDGVYQQIKDPNDNNWGEIGILTDENTGCKYISFSMSNAESGLTALLDRDGEPVCGNRSEKEGAGLR